MSYSVHNFNNGDTLSASQLNQMDAQIAQNQHDINGNAYAHKYVDVVWESGWINDTTGQDADSTKVNGRSTWIPYENNGIPVQTRVVSRASTDSGVYVAYRLFFYDSDKVLLSKTGYTPNDNVVFISKVAPAGTAYFRIKQYTVNVYTMKIEYGYTEGIGVSDRISASDRIPERSFSITPKRALRRPLVSIIDDDGHVEFESVYKSYLQQGIPIASAIDPVNWSTKSDRYMGWEKIIELKKIGCEFIVHGAYPWNYPNSNYASEASVREFFEAIQKEFRDHGLSHWDIAVYPQGNQHHELRSVCQDYFRGAFNVSPNDGKYYITPPIRTYNLQRFPFIGNTLETAKSVIDEAYDNNGWVVLYGHSYQFDNDQRTKFASIIEYVQSKGIAIVSNAEALNEFQNVLQIGDFYSSATTYNCRVVGHDGSEFNNPQIGCNGISFSVTDDGLLRITEVE